MSAELVEIDCGEVCTIMQSMDLFAQLSVAYEENKTVSLDVSKVNKIDTAVLQLLYSFQQDAVVIGMVVQWSDASTAFKTSTELLGMPTFYIPISEQ